MIGSSIKRLKGRHIKKRNKNYFYENRQTAINHPLSVWVDSTSFGDGVN